MPERSIRRIETTIAWLFLPIAVFSATAVVIVGLIIASRLHDEIVATHVAASAAATANHNQIVALRKNAIAACNTTNTARSESNAHLRDPLRKVAATSKLILAGAARSARQNGNPAQASQLDQLAGAFGQAAAEVEDLPQLDCAALNGGK